MRCTRSRFCIEKRRAESAGDAHKWFVFGLALATLHDGADAGTIGGSSSGPTLCERCRSLSAPATRRGIAAAIARPSASGAPACVSAALEMLEALLPVESEPKPRRARSSRTLLNAACRASSSPS